MYAQCVRMDTYPLDLLFDVERSNVLWVEPLISYQPRDTTLPARQRQ